jgi:hypothetical protein
VLKEYELTSDLTAVDEVNADTEKPTGRPLTTLPKGTTFYILLQRHRSKQFPWKRILPDPIEGQSLPTPCRSTRRQVHLTGSSISTRMSQLSLYHRNHLTSPHEGE